MGIISWLIFGALVGWIASIIMSTNERQGALGNIIVGIIGALLGGMLGQLLGLGGIDGFNVGSFLLALDGSVILLAVVKLFTSSNSIHD